MAQSIVGRSGLEFVPFGAKHSNSTRLLRKKAEVTHTRAPGHQKQPGRSRRSVRNFVPR